MSDFSLPYPPLSLLFVRVAPPGKSDYYVKIFAEEGDLGGGAQQSQGSYFVSRSISPEDDSL